MVRNFIVGTAIAIAAVASAGVFAQDKSTPIPVAENRIAGDIVYGNADAPIEVIEYGSFTCPHCASFEAEVLPFLKEELISTGKVKFVFRNFVRDRLDMAVALATRCTSDLEQAKRLKTAFFTRQREWVTAQNPPIAITSIALTGGVPTSELNECQADKVMMQRIIDDMKAGHEKYEIKSIPTIVVNGAKVQYANYEELKDKLKLMATAQ
ncbi:thioredoxin domain-containing protein [Kordiimonas sp. SCSIO 12603]|uniref:DsbA family protein n=1 Tax=Kordiimonas sp. SCSIO 12603 TaxID=2829596 RepID=UPI002102559D|nr:thioredoxin domain-containing protein [Kordiimonas sp. SCSIO 12603]UTW58144.1 thioredoxin domain-containing protein [Kordiimonas sp. SCSIO 12603]